MAIPNLDPNFEWSWQGVLKKAAQSGMEGYNPAASNAANQMQGYAPTPEPSVVDAGSQGGAVDRGMPGEIAQQNAAQEAQRAEQIKALEGQIAEIQARIAQNQAKLKNFTGSTNKIAALEARKINSQDPTMIWRWQKQREDTAKANAMNNKISSNKFINEAEALLKTEMPESYAEQVQQLKNVRMKIAEGKTIGADTSALEAQERELSENVEATHQNDKAVKSAKSKMNELKRQLAMNAITPTQYRDGIKSLIGTFDNDELNDQLYTEFLGGNKAIQNKNKAEAEAKEFDEFIKSRGLDPKKVSPQVRATLDRIWKKKRGK